MGDILPFPARKDQDEAVWVCFCGCYSYKLMAAGHAVCLGCGATATTADQGRWTHEPKDMDAPLQPQPDGMHRIRSLGSVELALRSMLKRIDAEKTAFLIIMDHDGAVHAWGEDATDPEIEAWFRRQIEQALTMMRVKR